MFNWPLISFPPINLWNYPNMYNDDINNPAHYDLGGIEVWDAITAWDLNYNLGNVVKYIARSSHKGAKLRDLRKARAYLNREIDAIEDGIIEDQL